MDDHRESPLIPSDKVVAIYHVVHSHEDFHHAAQTIFKLIRDAQRTQPGRTRKIFLDIEGHRNSQGGFDADMMELQRELLIGGLIRFVTEIHCPLLSVRNPEPQDNEVPDTLEIREKRNMDSWVPHPDGNAQEGWGLSWRGNCAGEFASELV